MSTVPRMVSCPTCHGSFPRGKGMISVCPRCGERVLVPSVEGEDEEAVDLPEEKSEIATIPVRCMLCGSLYYAKPAQIGEQITCPDCHTENVVPQLLLRTEPESDLVELTDEEDFKLSEPVDTPRYQALSKDALQFERAIRSQDGLEVRPIPPLPPPPPLAASTIHTIQPTIGPDDDDEFRLSDPTPPPQYVPIERGAVLPTTSAAAPAAPTRTPLAPAQPAPRPTPPAAPPLPASAPQPVAPQTPEEIELFPEDLVPIPTPEPPTATPPGEEEPVLLDEEDEDSPVEVRVAEPVERVEHRAVPQMPQADAPEDRDDGSDFTASMKTLLPEGLAKVTQAVENFNPYDAPREVPPEILVKRPFSSGIFSFLLQPFILMRWMFLVALVAIDLWAMGVVLQLYASDEGGAVSAVAQVMGLLVYVAAFIPGILAAMVIGATSITVLEETANGRDRIEGGGSFFSFEWMGGMMFVGAAAFVSVMPAAILTFLLSSLGASVFAVALLLYPTAVLLFPPMLLSMLEADSVTVPLTKDMMRSFLPLIRFWATFYVLTLLLGFVGIVALFCSYLLGFVSTVIVAAIVTAIPFLYFRLLGRMAMVYRDYVFATTPEEIADC